MTKPDTSLQSEAMIIPFRQRTTSGRPSDKTRILALYNTGQITAAELDVWLREGGHSCQRK